MFLVICIIIIEIATIRMADILVNVERPLM